MARLRGPFQGVWNIVRFNWHFYVLATGVSLILCGVYRCSHEPYRSCAGVACVMLVAVTLLSLLVSFYIYDLSDLYRLKWAGDCPPAARVVNVHAGFDETSALLKERFPTCELIVLDFYDPGRHTEVSIKRARSAYPAFPGSRSISTSAVPLDEHSVDKIFITLSAHEIRNNEERVVFFKALGRSLKRTGRIVVTEHLRDLPNFLAYSVGCFHFLPARQWVKTFHDADLTIAKRFKTTPFITTFILEKHGSPT